VSIESRVVESLTPVPVDLVERVDAGLSRGLSHAHWVGELACLHEVEVTRPPSPATAASPARVVAWNAERGRDVPSLARVLEPLEPELLLLTEMDLGMARSGNCHTARELAARLGMGCVYGVEFVELGLGGPDERAALAGQTNREGLHGGAILSRAPLEDPVVVRLEPGGSWFDARERGESRIGGRIAVMATWCLAGQAVTVAAVHLESHSGPAPRAAHVEVLLDAIETRAQGGPCIVGGDLNTFSLAHVELSDRETLRAALEADPRRLIDPVRYEPLFALARSRGFSWEPCNQMGVATHRVDEPRPSARGGLKLDWLLVRGLECSEPVVLEAVHSETGAALSDHEPIAVSCRL
jgi:endonuclease/exonuclease/phosphatase family metal-dependent hydrolase